MAVCTMATGATKLHGGSGLQDQLQILVGAQMRVVGHDIRQQFVQPQRIAAAHEPARVLGQHQQQGDQLFDRALVCAMRCS